MTRPTGYNPTETHTEDGLPRERLRAISRRTFVIEWSVALLVVVLINFVALASLERFDPNRFRVQVEVKYDRLRDNGADYDSLILGDSTPNQGIMPSVLNEKVGGSWLNLATVADMQAISDAWLLGDYIDLYGPPKRVIISHVPNMWGRQLNATALSEAPIPLDQFAKLDPPIELSTADRLRQVRARYLPIYSKNESLTQMLKKPWRIKDLRTGFGPDGFMAVQGKIDHWGDAVVKAINESERTSFGVADHNEQAIQRVIELAEQHGFMVYLTPGSAAEPLANSEGYQRNFQAMIQQMHSWAKTSDQLVVLLPTPQSFPDKMMYDEEHVNDKGAVVWSVRIAEALMMAKSDVGDSDSQTERP